MPKRCSIRKLFKAIDSDGSGEISLTELKTAFKKAAGADNKLTYKELTKSCRKASRKSARRGDAIICPGNSVLKTLTDENNIVIGQYCTRPRLNPNA